MKSKESLSLADTNSNDTIRITNNSGAILSVLSSSNTSKQGSNSLYENTLTLFPTLDGEKKILNEEIAIVKLTGNTFITRAGKTEPNFLYSLMFVTPDTFSPIGHSNVSNLNGPYPPISVTLQQREKMNLAKKFYQRVLAYPASQLATGFKDALDRVGESNEINAVDTYFQQGLETYKTLNFSSVMMEISYMDNCAGFWGNNKESFTFYLYIPWDDYKVKETQPKFIGTLEFTKTSFSSNVIDIRKMYTITFKDEEGTSFPVDFIRRLFKSESPVLSLAPVLILQSQLSGNIKDDKIIAALAGQIHGVKVIGLAEKLDFDVTPKDVQSNNDWSFFRKPTSFAQIFSLMLAVFGVTSLLAITAKIAWWKYNKIKGSLVISNPPQTPAEEESEMEELSRRASEDFEGASLSLDEFSITTTSASWAYQVQGLTKAKIRVINNGLRQAQLESIDHLKKTITELEARIGSSSMSLVRALESLNLHRERLMDVTDQSSISNVRKLLSSGQRVLHDATHSFQAEAKGFVGKERDNVSNLRELMLENTKNLKEVQKLMDWDKTEQKLLDSLESTEVKTFEPEPSLLEG